MRKISLITFLSSLIFMFISCATTMNIDKTVSLEIPNTFTLKSEPDMEFIGFKADANLLSTSEGERVTIPGTWAKETYTFPSEFDLWKKYKANTCLKKVGSVLQDANVAYDQSFAYFGIYSLQELELYKSKKRFVTFIEVNKHRLGGTVKDPGSIPGAIIAGSGFGLAIGGGSWMLMDEDNKVGLQKPGKVLLFSGLGIGTLGSLLMMMPATTELSFVGEYQIYVYDTEKKEIVYKVPVSISEKDKFKGSYFNENTNKNAVDEYYATLVYNALLEKYNLVDQFISNYNK